jgi:hypothetical protein
MHIILPLRVSKRQTNRLTKWRNWVGTKIVTSFSVIDNPCIRVACKHGLQRKGSGLGFNHKESLTDLKPPDSPVIRQGCISFSWALETLLNHSHALTRYAFLGQAAQSWARKWVMWNACPRPCEESKSQCWPGMHARFQPHGLLIPKMCQGPSLAECTHTNTPDCYLWGLVVCLASLVMEMLDVLEESSVWTGVICKRGQDHNYTKGGYTCGCGGSTCHSHGIPQSVIHKGKRQGKSASLASHVNAITLNQRACQNRVTFLNSHAVAYAWYLFQLVSVMTRDHPRCASSLIGSPL